MMITGLISSGMPREYSGELSTETRAESKLANNLSEKLLDFARQNL
jgi:hypothetical protein